MFEKIKRIKSLKQILETVDKGDGKLARTLTLFDLTMLGIGAIIGAGIFVIVGTASSGDITAAGEVIRPAAGPGIMLSFVITAIGCGFCALCYAELASMIPVSGSAYTYAYVSMGELLAWVIGWCLMIEYTFDAATVAIGWSGYFREFLEKVLHLNLPEWLITPTFASFLHPEKYPAYPQLFGFALSVNLPAILIIATLTALLIMGVKKSAAFNTVVVILKVVVIFIVVFVGAFYVKPSNWFPFMPGGFSGVLSGASLIFFAYIGFDALSTTSEEVKNPGRDIPKGIMLSLFICTAFYVIVAAILTGMVDYKLLNTSDPVATAFNYIGQHFLASYIVSVGAVIALISTLLVFLYGQQRVMFSMARDGFFPAGLTRIHSVYRTPYVAAVICGFLVMVLAGMCELTNVAAVCNAGTLAAFAIVCVSVIVLRIKRPDMPRKFRTPLVPLIPGLGIAISATLFVSLPSEALKLFLIWTIGGLVFYFLYGIRHTKYDDGK